MTHTPSGNKPHRAVSKRLKLCESCNKVWEIQYQTSKVLYHANFPTYKLGRKQCKKCRESIENRQKVCSHENQYYQPEEKDTNTPESLYCEDCGKDLEIPEPDWDLMLKE